MGHAFADVVDYTPRQMVAFVWLGQQRRKREHATTLSLNAMAARGKEQDLKKMHKELAREV